MEPVDYIIHNEMVTRLASTQNVDRILDAELVYRLSIRVMNITDGQVSECVDQVLTARNQAEL